MIKYYVIIVTVIFVFFVIKSIKYNKNSRKKIRADLFDSFGGIPKRVYETDEIKKIRYYFDKSIIGEYYIDEITYNDLDIEGVYKRINSSGSSVGDEYLYKILRMPKLKKEDILSNENMYRYFSDNEERAIDIQEIFLRLGRTKKVPMYEFIYKLGEIENKGNFIHYFCILLLLSSVLLFFLNPVVGIFTFLGVLIFNIGIYYRTKNVIENYYICFKYLIRMITCGEEIIRTGNLGIEKEIVILKNDTEKLKDIKKRRFLISAGNDGSLINVFMDYIRMIFHFDIIKFSHMTNIMKNNTEAINELYETLGLIETSISVASFRKSLDKYCEPDFLEKREIEAANIFHPLIKSPVANSIKDSESVILTGSNASGKSTFLKTIAINYILAQSINTCCAEKFEIQISQIYTSMALRDNLSNNESYFIVEIKSLKRIIDSINENIPIVCFIDEVLRGTNTVERIASSAYILKYISGKNALCFAATHDIELTTMLENCYSNYHFEEKIENDDVIFDYLLKSGKATSRNAIMLLKSIGFDNEIVNNAKVMAENFVSSGLWKM